MTSIQRHENTENTKTRKQVTNQMFSVLFCFLCFCMSVFSVSLFALPSPAYAEEDKKTDKEYQLPPGFQELNQVGSTTIPTLLGGWIGYFVLGPIGAFAIVMFVYGGVLWMTSGGNADNHRKAMTTITWAALGLIAMLTSYALLKFFFSALEKCESFKQEDQCLEQVSCSWDGGKCVQ